MKNCLQNKFRTGRESLVLDSYIKQVEHMPQPVFDNGWVNLLLTRSRICWIGSTISLRGMVLQNDQIQEMQPWQIYYFENDKTNLM